MSRLFQQTCLDLIIWDNSSRTDCRIRWATLRGPLKVTAEELNSVLKTARSAHISTDSEGQRTESSEPERCAQTQTGHPLRWTSRESFLQRAAGRQRGGLQKGAVLQRRREAPKTSSLKNRTMKRSGWEALQRGSGGPRSEILKGAEEEEIQLS